MGSCVVCFFLVVFLVFNKQCGIIMSNSHILSSWDDHELYVYENLPCCTKICKGYIRKVTVAAEKEREQKLWPLS